MCLPEGEKDSERSMALEAMLHSQQPHDPNNSFLKDLFNFNNNNNNNNNYNSNFDLLLPPSYCGVGSNNFWGYASDSDFNNLVEKQQDHHHQTEIFTNFEQEWNNNNNCSPPPPPMLHTNRLNNVSNEEAASDEPSNTQQNLESSGSAMMAARPKKRRAKSRKNKEEIENQRMTHIAVERNRRKQMNEYLSLLRSLMPESYVQRGDQASIIGGAINYVKELEQRLQFIGVQKETEGGSDDASATMPFSEFFAFPQYSSTTGGGSGSGGGESSSVAATGEPASDGQPAGIADIEVTMVESHASLKIRSKKRPKQLLKIVSSLHGMRLTILHLNVTTTGDVVLYSLSVKVEDDCKLGSVDEIAAAVYQMLERIQQESMC